MDWMSMRWAKFTENGEYILPYFDSHDFLRMSLENDDIRTFRNVAFRPAQTKKGYNGLNAIEVHGPDFIEMILENNQIEFFKLLIGNGRFWENRVMYPIATGRSTNLKDFVLEYINDYETYEMQDYLEKCTNWMDYMN